MGDALKCSLCNKNCCYKSSQVATLGEHLLLHHPNVHLAHFTFEEGQPTNIAKKTNFNSGSKFQLNASHGPKMYQTTVETWRPGIALIKCHVCSRVGRPLIRKQQNKVAYTFIGALCLLGCWPLCFLPFVLGGSNIMNLYCKHCGAHMGTYDRKTGRRIPHSSGDGNGCSCKN